MDLSSKSEYIDIIRKNVYSYIVTTGIIVSIILGIVSVIFASVLFSIWKITNIMYYFLVFLIIVVFINTISFITAKRNVRKTDDLVRRFIDLVEKTSIVINCHKVELLELTPPPLIAVLKRDKYYIVIKYYGFYTEVNLLDPVKTSRSEGYAPVYLRKSSEILSSQKINSIEIRTFRITSVVTEPLEDAVTEGLFYSREFRIVERNIDSIVRIIATVLRELFESSLGIKEGGKSI